jgi:uncharacterized membrane protein YfcA
MAVATALATVCFTSISSVRAHHAKAAVLWPVVRAMAPGIVVGSWIGAQIAVHMPTALLSSIFAVFVAYSSIQMFLDRKPKPSRMLPGTWGMFGVGQVVGASSALVGAGGAFVSVPFMLWCNIKIHQAVGTSSALGFPVAVAGTLGYVWAGFQLPDMPYGAVGYLYLPAVLVVSVASVWIAPIGARAAHNTDIKPMKRAFAVLLMLVALYFFWR